MTVAEFQRTDAVERRLSEEIRQAALYEIDARALDEEQLSSILGLSQTAVYLLSLKTSWPLPVSVLVADALGLRVEVTVSGNGHNGGPS